MAKLDRKKLLLYHSKKSRVKKCRSNDIQAYRLVDMFIFQDILETLRCPDCHETGCLYIEKAQKRKKGLASMLLIACECGYEKQTYSSHTVEKNNDGGTNKGMKPFDVNIRFIYAMRTIGSGHTGLEKLCGISNLPKPMTVKNFNNISKTLRDTAKVVAENSTNAAARELGQSETITDIGVSADGSWQRRGFSSLNGIVAALFIDNGKVIVIEPMSRYCRECSVNTRKLQEDDKALEMWNDSHQMKCKLNHQGSAPAMEPVGADRIFSRSLEKRQLRCTGFYGDGDSKAFGMVEHIWRLYFYKIRMYWALSKDDRESSTGIEKAS